MHRYLVKMQEKTEKATETEASNKPATLVSVCIQVLKDLQAQVHRIDMRRQPQSEAR